MDTTRRRRMTGMLIHGFAVAHMITAALLAQTLVGDEAALTALTIAMVVAVAKMNGADWDSGMALAFLGVFAGAYVGVRGASFLVKWIPGVGNASNAAATFVTTEVLGWATYLFVNGGVKNPEYVTKEDARKLWNQAKMVQKEEENESKHAYQKMTEEDKAEFDDIMRELRNPDLPESTTGYLQSRLQKVLEKYAENTGE